MFCIVILFLLLHICLVTFISFISYTKVHLMHFNFIYFIAHSPSHIYHIWLYSYYILFQPHCLFLFFNQSLLWKLGVSLDKTLILNTYCIIWSWTPKVSLLFFTLRVSHISIFVRNVFFPFSMYFLYILLYEGFLLFFRWLASFSWFFFRF